MFNLSGSSSTHCPDFWRGSAPRRCRCREQTPGAPGPHRPGSLVRILSRTRFLRLFSSLGIMVG